MNNQLTTIQQAVSWILEDEPVEGGVFVNGENKTIVSQKPDNKHTCDICNQSFKNVTLHQSKSHKKDMWKIVIPKCFLDKKYWEDVNQPLPIKLYSFGKIETELHCEGGSTTHYSFYSGITSKNTIKTNMMKIDFPDNCCIEDIRVWYHLESDGMLIPVDKANYTIVFEEEQEYTFSIKEKEGKVFITDPSGQEKEMDYTGSDDPYEEYYSEWECIGVFYYRKDKHRTWAQGQTPKYNGETLWSVKINVD